MLRASITTLLLMMVALFSGCGGNLLSPPGPGPGAGRAGLTVTILWPERSEDRLIPQLTESIGLTLKDAGTPVDTRLVPRPSPSPRIAYASDRDGNYEIYVMNADGTGLTRPTNNTAEDTYPSWSPDGSKIAFTSDRDGNREIYVMNSDGSGQTRLTKSAGQDLSPSWSPDVTKIAFVSNRDGNWEVYAMNSDGTNEVNLTNHPADDAYHFGGGPCWSPDGAEIAFSSDRDADGYPEIYVMNSDGTNQVRLTSTPNAYEADPAWSPYGGKIAFVSYDGYHQQISLVNTDGTGAVNLTDDPFGNNWQPSWSPSGSKIAFMSNRYGVEIYTDFVYLMNPDGSGQTAVFTEMAHHRDPCLGPGERSTAVRFGGLALGRTYTLEVGGFPNADGTGNALASGSVQVVAPSTPNTYAVATLTLSSTVATVEVTPASPTVGVGWTIDFTATAKDASGNVVLTPPFQWSESSGGTLATIDQNGHFTALAGGSVTVTAAETESGVTGSALVQIS